MKKTRLLSLLLVLCMIVSVLAACGDNSTSNDNQTHEATPSEPSDGLEFTLEGDSYVVSGVGSCKDSNIIIPSTYNGKPVTAIGRNAFWTCGLTSIVIPEGVISIGYAAFRDCSSLKMVIIPNSVTSIEGEAFCWCRNLTIVTLPDSITTIGALSFRGCESLLSITIPDSVTTVNTCVFSDCTNLKDVYCKAQSKPDGWDSMWLDCDATVHWGS